MSTPHQPPVGSMYLYDCVTPPLVDGSYRLDVVTDVTYDGQAGAALIKQRLLRHRGSAVQSSRNTEVAGVYPPRNGHGGFDEYIPQIVISRRTLPWERRLTSRPRTDRHPQVATVDAAAQSVSIARAARSLARRHGWHFSCWLKANTRCIRTCRFGIVVPNDAYQRLEVADGIMCDSIEVEFGLLESRASRAWMS